MKITVIGTGYVGLPTGVGFAELGNDVICLDVDERKINTLKSGKVTIFEDGLEELFNRTTQNGKLKFSTSFAESIPSADIVILAVGTPPHPITKEADMRYIKAAAEELAKIDVSSIDFSEDHTFNKMIPNPIIKKKSNINTEIRGVEITDEFTAIHICYQNTKYDYGGWYSMDRTAYIRDKSTGRKYKLIAAENCAISPQKTAIEKDEKKIFTLYFEPIPSATREIDFIESDNSTWKFYGIKLVEK
jgi:hypothetical protein